MCEDFVKVGILYYKPFCRKVNDSQRIYVGRVGVYYTIIRVTKTDEMRMVNSRRRRVQKVEVIKALYRGEKEHLAVYEAFKTNDLTPLKDTNHTKHEFDLTTVRQFVEDTFQQPKQIKADHLFDEESKS